MIWSDSYLLDTAIEAEQEISNRVRLLFVRFGLDIQKDNPIYQFPIPVLGVRRVTWLGHKVWPLTMKEFEGEYGIRPTTSTSSSRPFYYVLLGYGTNSIRFYPTPQMDITASGDMYGSGTATNCVISAYRLADPENDIHIPDFLLKKVVRYYVMSHAYKKEGKGQNLQAAQYYSTKYEQAITDLKYIMSKVPRAVNLQTGDQEYYQDRKPAHPQPPPEYGVKY